MEYTAELPYILLYIYISHIHIHPPQYTSSENLVAVCISTWAHMLFGREQQRKQKKNHTTTKRKKKQNARGIKSQHKHSKKQDEKKNPGDEKIIINMPVARCLTTKLNEKTAHTNTFPSACCGCRDGKDTASNKLNSRGFGSQRILI